MTTIGHGTSLFSFGWFSNVSTRILQTKYKIRCTCTSETHILQIHIYPFRFPVFQLYLKLFFFFLRHNGPASAAPCQEGHFWKRSETKKRILRVAQKTQIGSFNGSNYETMHIYPNIRYLRMFLMLVCPLLQSPALSRGGNDCTGKLGIRRSPTSSMPAR